MEFGATCKDEQHVVAGGYEAGALSFGRVGQTVLSWSTRQLELVRRQDLVEVELEHEGLGFQCRGGFVGRRKREAAWTFFQ